MGLPDSDFNGIIIKGRKSQGIWGIPPRRHDANPFALSTIDGSECCAFIGWAGGAFRRHSKARPPGIHCAMARLESWSHDRGAVSRNRQAAGCRGGGASAANSVARTVSLAALDLFPAPRNNPSRTLPRRPSPAFPIPANPRLTCPHFNSRAHPKFAAAARHPGK